MRSCLKPGGWLASWTRCLYHGCPAWLMLCTTTESTASTTRQAERSKASLCELRGTILNWRTAALGRTSSEEHWTVGPGQDDDDRSGRGPNGRERGRGQGRRAMTNSAVRGVSPTSYSANGPCMPRAGCHPRIPSVVSFPCVRRRAPSGINVVVAKVKASAREFVGGQGSSVGQS